jgi:formate dehydrogenase
MLPADIEEDGEGQVRALIVSAGNPVVSGPGGKTLVRALQKLELMVAFDIYHNETNRNAHYILPTLTFLERDEWPFVSMGELTRPFIQYSAAVIPPVGEARDDYEIYSEIAQRMGMDAPSPSPGKQALARAGKLPDPGDLIDIALRNGPVGDHFGERPEGWSRERLRQHPHGVMVDDLPDDAHTWRQRLAYSDGKLRLWHDIVASELDRLFASRDAAPSKFTLIGRRDVRSINSWMHNIDRLVRSQQPTLLIHPDDAAVQGIEEGDIVRVSNQNGAIEIPAEISSDVMRGVVSYPHGWGHAAGWHRANQTEGQNMNVLLGLGVESVELVSGMTLIDCLAVSVDRSPINLRTAGHLHT